MLATCYATEEVRTRFVDIDIFYQCQWYRFPLKIRKALPIIISGSQKLDFLKVFGNITASRETCRKVTLIRESNSIGTKVKILFFYLFNLISFGFKVLRGGFTGFMILRQFLK